MPLTVNKCNKKSTCYKDHHTYQYGVPLNELHLCTVFVPRDDTPKSAVKSDKDILSTAIQLSTLPIFVTDSSFLFGAYWGTKGEALKVPRGWNVWLFNLEMVYFDTYLWYSNVMYYLNRAKRKFWKQISWTTGRGPWPRGPSEYAHVKLPSHVQRNLMVSWLVIFNSK